MPALLGATDRSAGILPEGSGGILAASFGGSVKLHSVRANRFILLNAVKYAKPSLRICLL
jgi:hypothetical protein